MRISAATTAVLAGVALAAAGCGGDGGGGSGGGESGGGAGGDAKPVNSGSAAVNVDMKDIKYVPQSVEVKRGGTITWTNSDSIPHTVTKTSGPGPKFDSGTMNQGTTFEQRFDAAGKIDYVCDIHPNQTGTITVR